MQFQRRHPRVAVDHEVLLTMAKGSLVGRLVDVSLQGAGVLVAAAVPRGERITLSVHPAREAVFSAAGHVVAVRAIRGGTERERFRIGIELDREDAEFLRRATPSREHAAGTRESPVPVCLSTGGTGPQLAATGTGRERLFQHARARLEEGDADEARRAALWAIKGDPRVSAYWRLFYHADARSALVRGDHRAAERAIDKGLAVAPGDAVLERMRGEIPPPRRSLWRRLTRS